LFSCRIYTVRISKIVFQKLNDLFWGEVWRSKLSSKMIHLRWFIFNFQTNKTERGRFDRFFICKSDSNSIFYTKRQFRKINFENNCFYIAWIWKTRQNKMNCRFESLQVSTSLETHVIHLGTQIFGCIFPQIILINNFFLFIQTNIWQINFCTWLLR
jgi:hypothetical protein